MEKQLEIRPSRKSKLKSIRNIYIDGLVEYQKNNKLSSVIVSSDELKEIKARIRKQLAQETKKRLILTFASVTFVCTLLGYYILKIIFR